MSRIKKVSTPFLGLSIIEPMEFEDDRGFFAETYNKRGFARLGLDTVFVQDNQSHSRRGVLRGLHFQRIHPQVKLVSVVRGTVFDVAVDLRTNSNTYGQYFGLELSEKNRRMLYIPEGFAHGFLALTEWADIIYKVSDYYYPEFDSGIVWNDADICIDWPLVEFGIEEPILSEKDSSLPTLRDLSKILNWPLPKHESISRVGRPGH